MKRFHLFAGVFILAFMAPFVGSAVFDYYQVSEPLRRLLPPIVAFTVHGIYLLAIIPKRFRGMFSFWLLCITLIPSYMVASDNYFGMSTQWQRIVFYLAGALVLGVHLYLQQRFTRPQSDPGPY
jgi:hypothetical protein